MIFNYLKKFLFGTSQQDAKDENDYTPSSSDEMDDVVDNVVVDEPAPEVSGPDIPDKGDFKGFVSVDDHRVDMMHCVVYGPPSWYDKNGNLKREHSEETSVLEPLKK